MNEAMKQKNRKWRGVPFELAPPGSRLFSSTTHTPPSPPAAITGKNRLEDGYWTYHLDRSFRELAKDVSERYGAALTKASMGVSAMMHGYLAFDKEGNQVARSAPEKYHYRGSGQAAV